MHPVLIIPLLAFWHAYTACASCMHNTHLDLRSAKADNQQAELDDFGYVGREGPTNWHTIDPQDLICATGRNQSPINIIPTEIRRTKRGDVRTEIPAEQTLSFVNQGTDVEVILRGTTTIGAKKFALRQFHYHTPGEHLINEEYFPVEVHLVHEAEGRSIIPLIFLPPIELHLTSQG